ncbi:hypothetical protein XENOCAPTIV_020906 [Xenoophorus captivus]|uniref:Uncharacterized protein n=1 Tax=Xenoophorus captivus TaxID=1517983 RepID=A0ABV0S350_9TELE
MSRKRNNCTKTPVIYLVSLVEVHHFVALRKWSWFGTLKSNMRINRSCRVDTKLIDAANASPKMRSCTTWIITEAIQEHSNTFVPKKQTKNNHFTSKTASLISSKCVISRFSELLLSVTNKKKDQWVTYY